jgi:hypothetical protein
MIKQHQMFRHDPDSGVYGDCHRTAIACLLDIHPEEVPHFGQTTMEAKKRGETHDWVADVERFLNSRGLTQVDVVYSGVTLDDLFRFMRARNPHTLYLLGGSSPRGSDHTIICRGGEFEWDPHPDGGFVIGPMSNGLFEVSFLLPISMKALDKSAAEPVSDVPHG